MIKVEEYQKKLMDGVKKVLESGNFRDFMAFSSNFRNYSFGNTMLIWCQKSDATYVAGFKTWNSLGRKVRKGEKGIVIFAPVTKKSRQESEDDAPEERSFLLGFRAVYVFDVSQTEGEPLLELNTGGDIKALLCADPEELFEKLVAFSPVPVSIEVLDGTTRGTYRVNEQRIIVSSSLTAAARCKTLLHELAHHLALATDLKDSFDIKGRSSHEVVAEGAAFIACSHFGIDSSGYSFTYLATWGQDYKKIIALGGVIRSVATRLIEIGLAESVEEEVA